MIRRKELEQVREINRKLPFADRIEPGPTFREWADEQLEFKLMPHQIRMGHALMRGGYVESGRQIGKTTTLQAVERYMEFGTNG